MNNKDEATENAEKSCGFGVMAEVLRNLQKEEMELTKACQIDISDTSQTKSMIELITEINSTLKEIAETQKKILEEIIKGKTE